MTFISGMPVTYLDFIPDKSVHLVVTSSPYWTLKEYRQHREPFDRMLRSGSS